MATLTNGTNLTGEITLNKQLNTLLTLATLGTYIDKNIQFDLDVRSASASVTADSDSSIDATAGTAGGTNVGSITGEKTSTEPSDGYYIKVNSAGSGSVNVSTSGWINQGDIASDSAETIRYYPVSAASGVINSVTTITPSSTLSGTNATLSTTDNGIYVTATGGGSASTTSTYSVSSAGYIPVGTDSAQNSEPATTTTETKYISGVTITTPSSGIRTFSVTVPNGDSTVTFTFAVDSNGNVTIE